MISFECLIKIIAYSMNTGKSPFYAWYDSLSFTIQAIIDNRLDRVRIGNFGDCKPIKGGSGLWELRIDLGPGYRIYYGKKGNTILIPLTGGDKGSQARDIEKAKRYWRDCKEELHEKKN